MIKFSIIITTRNRLEDLKITLSSLKSLLVRDDVELLVYDDASTDGTLDYLKTNYAEHKILNNKKSKGLIHNRNVLMSQAKGKYTISLDDDATFLSNNPLEIIENFFASHSDCAVAGFRIYWGLDSPIKKESQESIEQMKSFVGCGHVWNLEAWKQIPDYPSWFIFYGEEENASLNLFRQQWKIYYLPQVLVHHRVNVKQRKDHKDYLVRLRRSLRSSWYNYSMFYPITMLPNKIGYSIYQQLRLKVFKGEIKVLKSLSLAVFDLFYNLPRIIKQRRPLSRQQIKSYEALNRTKIYWQPK